MDKTIGQRIRDRRKYLHMSQQTLADKSKVCRTTISMLETGQCKDVLVSTLTAIASAMDTTVDFFMP